MKLDPHLDPQKIKYTSSTTRIHKEEKLHSTHENTSKSKDKVLKRLKQKSGNPRIICITSLLNMSRSSNSIRLNYRQLQVIENLPGCSSTIKT